jgi:hypothetical protein
MSETSKRRQHVEQQARRRAERRRADSERRLARAIAAQNRLVGDGADRRRPDAHEPDPRLAALTRSHD